MPDLPRSSSVYLVRPDGTGLRPLLVDERPHTAVAWALDGCNLAVCVDPQLGRRHENYPDSLEVEQITPPFAVLIVDRDGTDQAAHGRGGSWGTTYAV